MKYIRKFLHIIIVSLAASIAVYSCLQLASIYMQYDYIDKMDKKLISDVVTGKTNDALKRKINWIELKKINPDIIGWIYIPDTRIDYPIMKSDETYKYLKLNYMKQKSISGSIFLDQRNSSTFNDSNTIIYGHNMKNGSMFSDLRNFVDQKYMDKHINIYIYTPDSKVRIYKCFSGVYTEATSDMYQTDIDYSKYTAAVINMAMAKEKIDTTKKSPLVMLSTCTMAHSNKRTVLYGRLMQIVRQD